MRVRADRPHGYGCRGSCPCRPCQAGAAPSSRAVGAFSLRVVGELDSATSPSSAPFSLSRVDAIRRARQWSQDLRLTSRYYVGRSRRDLESDWVRFRSGRLWRAERHGARLSPRRQAVTFFQLIPRVSLLVFLLVPAGIEEKNYFESRWLRHYTVAGQAPSRLFKPVLKRPQASAHCSETLEK